MKPYLMIILALTLIVPSFLFIACGDDDDDDNDDGGDEMDLPTFDETGYGSNDDLLGAGVCEEAVCQAMLEFMDGCEFPCVDENNEPTACINLLPYCINCTGNWGCNTSCYSDSVTCSNFLQCCMNCQAG